MRLSRQSAARYLFPIAVFSCSTTFAQPDAGAFQALFGEDLNRLGFLKEHGIQSGGWLSTGGVYTTDNPDHKNNFPITFNDRSGEFHLNQLNFFVQKKPEPQSKDWNFGGRVDLMFGTDSRFAQATGLDNELIHQQDLHFYDLAIPQAYLDIAVPIAPGLSARIGHFYTLLGQEAVTSPQNFFYSHAYTMQYAEPFTHTGALFSYPLNNQFTLNFGAVAGWDNFNDKLSNWDFLGSVSWTDTEATSTLSWSLISGDMDDLNLKNRTAYSLVISHRFTDQLNYIFQHDFGYQQQAASNGNDAFWYGINQYIIYQLTGTLSAGFRGEWFRDADGTRIISGTPGDYFALTAGLNWKPRTWLTLRPECRYDWARSSIDVFDNQTEKNQLEFALDIVITF